MNRDRLNIGRNDPCPCGSGKKFKKCHGGVPQEHTEPAEEVERLKINREQAYGGIIGREREDFCVKFIERKQTVFEGIKKAQMETAKAKGEIITCEKGCRYCCSQYVDASIQEAEAIVYYLFRNEKILDNFLRLYPAWREKIRAAGDSFEKVVHRWEKTADGKWRDKKTVQGGLAELYEFAMANIPCPFLLDSICSIYGVRPYNCAGCYATTPGELCHPLLRNKARIYMSLPPDIVDDTNFYFKDLDRPVQYLMPVTVYKILTRGWAGVKELTGLSDLPES